MIDPDTFRPAMADQYIAALAEANEMLPTMLERLARQCRAGVPKDDFHSEVMTNDSHWRGEVVGAQVQQGRFFFNVLKLYRNHTLFTEISGGVVMDKRIPPAIIAA